MSPSSLAPQRRMEPAFLSRIIYLPFPVWVGCYTVSSVGCFLLVDFTQVVIRRRVGPIQGTLPCSSLKSWSTIINKSMNICWLKSEHTKSMLWFLFKPRKSLAFYKINCMFMHLQKAVTQWSFNLIFICNFMEGYKAPNSLTKYVQDLYTENYKNYWIKSFGRFSLSSS